MKTRKITVFIYALLPALLLLCSCAQGGWKGYYQEDLSQYITLCDYKNLSYTVLDTSVSDEEVREEIERALSARTELVETDGEVGEESTVKLDRYCFIDGVSTPEYSEASVTYVCSESYSDDAINGILAQIRGMKKGDTKEVSVTLSQGDGGEKIQAVYRVTVLAVYEQKIPELTDGLVPYLMQGCKTVAEYKEAVKNELLKAKAGAAEDAMRAELWKKAIDESLLKLAPAAVADGYYNALYESYQSLADAESVSLDEYLENDFGMTFSQLKEQLVSRANDLAKEDLVLYSIIRAENLTCTDDELIGYAEREAVASGDFADGEEYIDYYGKQIVTEQVLKEKVINLIVDNATPMEE